jgi:phage tail sheath protein FI
MDDNATAPQRPTLITPVPTSTAAFIGRALLGPVNRPTAVSSFFAFQQQFGGFSPDSELAYALRQFFLNGGSSAWVVRTASEAADADILQSIRALDSVDAFNLLVLPGTTVPAILGPAAEYCRKRRAFFVMDAPLDAATPAQMSAAIATGLIPQTNDAAVYYPRPKISDPLNPGQLRSVPPSGTVAGLIACTDSTWGVWKAPGGPEIVPRGVQGLDYALNEAEADQLGRLGINCFRDFPARGPLLWGARTLAGADTAASEWKYIPVRRLALFLEESIDRGTQWAIFEPNDEKLWSQIRSQVEDFLLGLFRQGAFQGQKPADAFFARCDGTTTTPEDVAFGIVNIDIGFAPLRPAEFVLLRIGQKAQPPGS